MSFKKFYKLFHVFQLHIPVHSCTFLFAVTFFWKVLFAVMIPPPKYAGGWLTFVISLVMIGLLTALVGDLAAIFGCLLGMKARIIEPRKYMQKINDVGFFHFVIFLFGMIVFSAPEPAQVGAISKARK